MSNNTTQNTLSYKTAKALIRAAVTIVDGDGEFELGDSYARITVIDAHTTVRIDDANGAAHIEVETENGIQFHAITQSYDDFQVETYLSGDWEQVLLDYASDITPTRHWTFG